ncbi:T9SS type A sorting domain-containing protein [Aequorivita marisscotiae]|uniref:T9SS type A sorting domain-containing protein n=1 Tax=Aequorivita marisscotiae TaxID=3040348 RepID=A0ABY8KUP7_9FLAO|nr:T9SS type A sorting domain-containing protein [Aequorivita sp. Ant34-E75]WGF93150.1 T9SS type A sorting domain-containing protein [Aequorivita sp. Ant34-E75]
MKRFLFFSILGIFCLTISAQTKTWVGPSGGNFNVDGNWDPFGVPSSTHDVIIPTGSVMTFNASANIKSFDFQGNAMVTIEHNISTSSVSSISTNVIVTWTTGQLSGNGTINNLGIVNIVEGPSSSQTLRDQLILNNEGTINFNDSGLFKMGYGTPTLNNLPTGILNLNTDTSIVGGNSQWGSIVNTGLIKRAQGTGVFEINAPLLNNNGTILVESGTLQFTKENTVLTDGTYNVATNGTLEWSIGINPGIICEGTLSGQLDGPINWNRKLSVATGTEAIFDFDGPAGVNWFQGDLQDDGTLTNLGILNIVDGGQSTAIRDQITLNNEGTININESGQVKLGYGNPSLNNLPTGVINLNSDGLIVGGNSQWGTIVNTGLIKRAQGTGVFEINAPLLNNNGTILVESGTLQFTKENTVLTDGIYNVATNGILEWHIGSNPGIICEGTLSGQLAGPINWNRKLSVATGTEAIFDFDGPAGVNWFQGDLQDNGTLYNLGILNIADGGQSTAIRDQITLNNEGTINVNESGQVKLGYGNPTLNNLPTGVINLNTNGSIVGGNSEWGTIVNTGIIKRAQEAGTFNIQSNVNNTGSGKIIAETGNLEFSRSLQGDGILMGNGSVQLGSNIIFEGTLSPGGYPGTLTHINDYASSTNAILAIEIYGPNAGSQFDVYDVQGDAILEGTILVDLNYEANLNDEFVILTANDITTCNLPASVTAHHDGHNYTFDVICNPNDVTLKVSNIVLGTEENSLSNLTLFPNPSNGQFIINLGQEYTNVSVQITNMLGQLISEENYTSAKTIEQQINASAGMYFVKVSTAKEGSNTLRIIKQ